MNPFRKSVPPFFQLFSGLLLLFAAAFILLNPHPVRANIATDGTVGPMQTLTGPDFIIPQDMGALRGQNLFHSFRTFNIDTGQSATFTGENSIANVISRVTGGGEASHINGLLRSTIGQADFYFINPSGVVFGPQAEVDVPAAFHVSTADELKFADGSSFSATDTGSSTLTQAAPEAFGFLGGRFLGGQAGNIEINGSRFEFGSERTLSLSAGDITIQGGVDADGEAVTPILQTEAGHIYLTAVGNRAATVYPDGHEESDAGGNLLLDGARVDVSGDGGGRIFIQAGNAVVGGSSYITSDNRGTKNAESGVDALVHGRFDLTDGSQIRSDADSKGSAGSIRVSVQDFLQILNGSDIVSDTWSEGNAGNVTVTAGSLHIDRQESRYFTGVTSLARTNSKGNAGMVEITVTGLMQLLNGGQISSDTSAKGDAGNVSVTAGELTIDGQGSQAFTVVASEANRGSEGNAGTVEITVTGLMQLLNGGIISSSTGAKGDAGDVRITAGELTIDRQDSQSFTAVASDASRGSEGNAGTVEITVTGLMQLLNGGRISSSTSAKGDAGNIILKVPVLIIESGFIRSAASDTATGMVGNVEIYANTVSLAKDSEVSIAAFQRLPTSRLVDFTKNHIIIEAGTLSVDDNSKVTSESRDNVPSSDIVLQVNQVVLKNNSEISTQSRGADAGAITILGNVIHLQGSRITTSAEGTTGDGGDITFQGFQADDPIYLVMNGGLIQANTAAADAKGGDINLALRGILLEKNSGSLDVDNPERQIFQSGSGQNIIQAAAEAGTKGQINIGDAPELDISGDLVQMQTRLAEPATLAIDPCDLALAWETASSLVQGSRGGLPVWPGAGSGVLFDSRRLKKILEEVE